MTFGKVIDAKYSISAHNQHEQTKKSIHMSYIGAHIIFGVKDAKKYVVIAKHVWGWTSRYSKTNRYDVYYRKNFATKEDGNAAYNRVKKLLMSDPKGSYSSFMKEHVCYDGPSDITVDQIIQAINGR